MLSPRCVASPRPNTLTLDFDGGADAIPTHSLADLATCARQGRRDYFREHFAGKVVLLGTLLDELERRQLKRGLITLCVGGGMGIATVIERV